MHTIPRLLAYRLRINGVALAVNRTDKARQDHLQAAMTDRLEPQNPRC